MITDGASATDLADVILGHYTLATPEQRMAGLTWYAKANHIAGSIAWAHGITTEQAAAIIAHLSPRNKWANNVEQAWSLVESGEAKGLTRCIDNAKRVLLSPVNVEATFGKGALKTRAFYRNILASGGDDVTVDIWAARGCGWGKADLSHVQTYEMIARAYRMAAEAVGIDAAQMQAVVWVVVRGAAE